MKISGSKSWNDWRWQLRNQIRDERSLERFIRLTGDERRAIRQLNGHLPLGLTPYYAALAARSAPLRRTVVPCAEEFRKSRSLLEDPLGEERHSPVPGLVHTYPDKVLFLVTDQCPVYCRFCTRSRLVGTNSGLSNLANWNRALDYIARTPAVRDVLISGGEPLTLSDSRLEWLLRRLRKIPHVELIRISTKAPAVLPQRFTRDLVRMLKRYHPLWLSVHFTHPDELTPEVEAACNRIADAGIPMCSQTVLLKGVNDDPAVMKQLMLGLLKLRVKPYYLHHCDMVAGASHFRTPVQRGLEVIRNLHGHTTGYAAPTYVVDAPGGGGKVPLLPDYVASRHGRRWVLKNYRGRKYPVEL